MFCLHHQFIELQISPRCSQRKGSVSQRNSIVSELAASPFFLTVSMTKRALSLRFCIPSADSLSESVITVLSNSLSSRLLRTGPDIPSMKSLRTSSSLLCGGRFRALGLPGLFTPLGERQTRLSQTLCSLESLLCLTA